eukprot:4920676-Pyramimonas_sp.AAC.1
MGFARRALTCLAGFARRARRALTASEGYNKIPKGPQKGSRWPQEAQIRTRTGPYEGPKRSPEMCHG